MKLRTLFVLLGVGGCALNPTVALPLGLRLERILHNVGGLIENATVFAHVHRQGLGYIVQTITSDAAPPPGSPRHSLPSGGQKDPDKGHPSDNFNVSLASERRRRSPELDEDGALS